MKYALLRCCVTPAFLKQYESSTDAVLEKLGVDLADIPAFNCCGYPVRNSDFKSYVLLSARNLSLAEKENLDITTLCSCCYGSSTHVDSLLKTDASLRREINGQLEKEGLKFNGDVRIRHLLEILYRDIGIEQIEKQLVKSAKGLRVATHSGCHLIRPRQLGRHGGPEKSDKPHTAGQLAFPVASPAAHLPDSLFDSLVEVSGAESIDWPTKHQCCGSPVWGTNDELSMDLTQKKIDDARNADADFLCVVCPYCQLQFDRVQNTFLGKRNGAKHLPPILYTQLLGLCLGVDESRLGMDQNEMDIIGIKDYLAAV